MGGLGPSRTTAGPVRATFAKHAYHREAALARTKELPTRIRYNERKRQDATLPNWPYTRARKHTHNSTHATPDNHPKLTWLVLG